MNFIMNKYKKVDDWFIDIFSYTALGIYAILVLIPVLSVMFKAVSADWAVTAGKVIFTPIGFQLDTLKYVCASSQFINSFSISIFMTLLGSVGAVILTSLTAYPLSKKNENHTGHIHNYHAFQRRYCTQLPADKEFGTFE